MEIEQKEIRESLHEIFDKKGVHLRKWIEFKTTLKNQGENKAADTLVVDHEKLHKFFQRELKEISEVIQLFSRNPVLLS